MLSESLSFYLRLVLPLNDPVYVHWPLLFHHYVDYLIHKHPLLCYTHVLDMLFPNSAKHSKQREWQVLQPLTFIFVYWVSKHVLILTNLLKFFCHVFFYFSLLCTSVIDNKKKVSFHYFLSCSAFILNLHFIYSILVLLNSIPLDSSASLHNSNL